MHFLFFGEYNDLQKQIIRIGAVMKELSKILIRFISLILGIEQLESFPPPLSKDEEAEAFEKMRSGDKKAREIIIERNRYNGKDYYFRRTDAASAAFQL